MPTFVIIFLSLSHMGFHSRKQKTRYRFSCLHLFFVCMYIIIQSPIYSILLIERKKKLFNFVTEKSCAFHFTFSASQLTEHDTFLTFLQFPSNKVVVERASHLHNEHGIICGIYDSRTDETRKQTPFGGWNLWNGKEICIFSFIAS